MRFVQGLPELPTRLVLSACGALMFIAGTGVSRAQETPASPAPTAVPAAIERPTLMDIEYDGHLHVTAAPYVWLPTMHGDFQFTIPTLHRGSHTFQTSVSTGPSEYVSKINGGFMGAIDVRQGNLDVFGDYIYANLSSSASIESSITTRRDRQVPVYLGLTPRLSARIWEAAAGYTVARSHNADFSIFMGFRGFPLDVSSGYDAVIGKRGLIAPSGTITPSAYASDVVAGFRGKVFFGDGHLFVPYYADIGSGDSNQTWEGYAGVGYAFNHGQTLSFDWRSLNYYDFPPTNYVQKLTMSGPLLGYSFGL